MGIRVSVIVAVYNTGPFIEPLIDSLLGQTMARDEFEMIFVDDGSTDATPARLDRLAAEHDNVIVRHEPNSGWPGRPRNIGIDLARGDHVFFADHDDWFGREALQRMADYADETRADVLIGRYAGHRRGVAKAMFDRNRPHATLSDTPLMDSLTPHKMFRAAFLAETGLRFPEGRRRLEDHVFVVEAFFLAERIAVLSDYHCYFHTSRPDAGNAGYQRIDPPSYYGYNREVIDIILARTEPGALRERCLRRPLRQEILGRLDGASFLAQDPAYQRSLFDEGRKLALETIPPEVDRGLSPPQRLRAALLRDNHLDQLLAYVGHQVGIRARVRLDDLWWDTDGRLVLDVDGALIDRDTGEPVSYGRDDDGTYLRAPAGVAAVVPRSARDCTAEVGKGRIQLVLRRREDSEEWPIPTESTRDLDTAPDAVRVSYRGRGRLDPLTLGGGRPLTRGIWDVYAKINECGWTKEIRLGALRSDAVDLHRRSALLGGTAVVPYWTQTYDNLSLDVGAGAAALSRGLDASARIEDSRTLVVELALVAFPAAPHVTLQLTDAASGRTLDLEPTLRLEDAVGRAVVSVPLDTVAKGTWRVLLGLDLAGWGKPRAIGAAVEVRADGTGEVIDDPQPDLAGPAKTETTATDESLPKEALVTMPLNPTARRLVKRVLPEPVWRAAGERYRRVQRRRLEQGAPKGPEDADLTALAKQFRTDKWGHHYYTPHYQRHFEHLRDRPIRLLEIGIGGYARERAGGASLRMWKAFFPKAQIVGLDLQDKSFVEEDRIKVYQGDQSDPALLARINAESGPFDIIIDDGSHRVFHVLPTFHTLFPLLLDGGLYVVEDIQSSYWPEWGGSEDRNSTETSMGVLKGLADSLNYEEFVDESYEPTYYDLNVVGLHFYHNLVFIEKGRNAEGTKRRTILKDRYRSDN